MNSALSIVPLLLFLLLVPAIYGLIVKLSARILRYNGITWKLGFLFGLLVVLFTLIVQMVIHFTGVSVPFILNIAISLTGNLIIGGWFFSTRGEPVNGKILGWPGALKLSGLSYVILTIIGIGLTMIPKMLSVAVMP